MGEEAPHEDEDPREVDDGDDADEGRDGNAEDLEAPALAGAGGIGVHLIAGHIAALARGRQMRGLVRSRRRRRHGGSSRRTLWRGGLRGHRRGRLHRRRARGATARHLYLPAAPRRTRRRGRLGPGGLLLIRFSVSSLVMLGHIVLSWNRSSGRGRNAPLFGKELYDTPPHARTGILGLGVTFTHARPPAPRRGPFTTACPRNLREFQKYSQNMTGFLKIWKASATAGKREAPLTRQVSSQRGRTVLVEPKRKTTNAHKIALTSCYVQVSRNWFVIVSDLKNT